MLSLENIAVVKIAIKICDESQLKKEIFCLHGSQYDTNKISNSIDREQWNRVLEKKAVIILENLGYPKQLQENVACIVPAIGRRILSWAIYHERTLGYLRNFSFNIFRSSFFTQNGILDCKKAAKEMMKDNKILSVKQKYKLALLYCMNEYIPDLNTQLTEYEKNDFYDSRNPESICQPDFVKFWSYYLKNDVDKLRQYTDPNLYWLQMAVRTGNIYVVEYCLVKTNLIRDESALIYAALEAVKSTQYRLDTGNPRVPYDYYIDVMFFLFSKMSEKQQIKFLIEDIEGNYNSSRVLGLFLHWPYQNYFMKIAKLMLDFLPRHNYLQLIDFFLAKIGALNRFQRQSEEKDYNYRELFREFWNEIPERHIRFILKDPTGRNLNFDKQFLFELFTLKNLIFLDKINIIFMLHNGTAEEKDHFIFSGEGIYICTELMSSRRWKILDEFVSSCCASKQRIENFKKYFSFTEEARHVCIDFIKNNEWSAAEYFILWSSLPEAEVNQLKEDIILSEYGRELCLKMILIEGNLTAVEKVIRWSSLPEDKLTVFKKELIFSPNGNNTCVHLVISNHTECANEFTNWSLSSEEDIIKYKKYLIKEIGIQFWETLISDVSINEVFDKCPETNYRISRTIRFNGGNWEEVETLLTWCFSSEDDMSAYKKSLAVKTESLIDMHLNLILAHKWDDAEILFAWLELSSEEIRKLKKETIFSEICMMQMNVSVQDYNLDNFLDYAGGKWEEIELLLRWCLTDLDDVLEFENRFDEEHGFKSYGDRLEKVPGGRITNLNRFQLLINEFLIDMYQQSEKRKRNTLNFENKKTLLQK